MIKEKLNLITRFPDRLVPDILIIWYPNKCDIDCVPNVARKKEVKIALNNSYAFGGNNACLVLRKLEEKR